MNRQTSQHASVPGIGRRSLLAGAATVLGGSAAMVSMQATAQGQTSAAGSPVSGTGASLLDKWVSTKKAKLGFWLSAKPIQFTDPKTNKPTGYSVELAQMMMSELGVEIDYEVMPFAQLFSALAAGKIDMIGAPITATPARALRGLFAEAPAFFEDAVVVLKPGSTVKRLTDLKNASFSVLSGSSHQVTGKVLFPNATFQAFDSVPNAVANTASGRSDAVLLSTGQLLGQIEAHPNLIVLPGPSVFVDINTFMVPLNDFKTQAWVTNWLKYQAAHGTLSTLWEKYVVTDVGRKLKLQTYAVGLFGTGVPTS